MRSSQTIRLKYIWYLKFEAHGQHPTLPSSRARDATTRRPPLKLHPPELYSCSSWTLYAQGVQLYLRSTVFSKNHGMRVKTLGEEIARRQRLNQNNNPSVIAPCPSWYPTRTLFSGPLSSSDERLSTRLAGAPGLPLLPSWIRLPLMSWLSWQRGRGHGPLGPSHPDRRSYHEQSNMSLEVQSV